MYLTFPLGISLFVFRKAKLIVPFDLLTYFSDVQRSCKHYGVLHETRLESVTIKG